MAADDDEMMDDELGDGFIEEGEEDAELEGEPDELDEEDDFGGDEELVEEGEESEDGDAQANAVKSKKKARKEDEEDDEDEEMLTEDDIEADLGEILKARIEGRKEDDEEEGEEEEEEVPTGADTESSIQPRRADERMCKQCFLLVRKGAPNCPVGDDTCPLFS